MGRGRRPVRGCRTKGKYRWIKVNIGKYQQGKFFSRAEPAGRAGALGAGNRGESHPVQASQT